jgi:O-antigen/teichoic acid export membrane protein
MTESVTIAPPAPVDDTPPRSLGRNFSMLAGSQVVTWALSVAWTLLIPRLLGPTEMGYIVTATAVTGILGVILGSGLKTFLVREIVAQPGEGPRLVGTAFVLRLVLLPVFIAAAALWAEVAGYGGEETMALYLATGAVFLTMLAEPAQAAFQARERMEYLAYHSVVDEVAQSFLGIGLAFLGVGASGLFGASLVVAGCMLVLNVRWLRPVMHIEVRTNLRRIGSLLAGSTAYWAFGLFFMIYLWIDSTLLSLLAGPEVVAWYGVPTKLFTTLMFVPVIFSTIWLPRFVSAHEEGGDRLYVEARQPTELVLLLSLPILVATAVSAQPIIALLYGPSYAPAAPVLAILAFIVPPMYLNILVNQLLVAKKRQAMWTWVMAGATVVNPLMNLVLIRACEARFDNGAIGAAISLLITEILVVAVGLVMVGGKVLDRSSLWRLAKAVLAAGAMWAAMVVAQPIGFIGAAVVGLAVFAGLALLFRVPSATEIDLARDLTLRLRRRLNRGG